MLTAAFKTQDNQWVARRVLMARSFRQRLLGLLGHKTLDADAGLLLSPGASIHTFGMRFPIDAVFLNGQMKILRLAAHIPPWRVRLAPSRTKHVLELPAGKIHALGLKADTFLCLELSPIQARTPLIKPMERAQPHAGRTRQDVFVAHGVVANTAHTRPTQVELE